MSNMVNLAKKKNIMHKQKNEQLKNKIIEAVPEILDLKFRCEYEYVIMDENGEPLLQLGLWGYTGTPSESEIEKIIGRPITLEDVFVVLTKTADTRDDYDAKDYVFDLCRMCKLNQPLEKQLDETLEFWYNLLIKK